MITKDAILENIRSHKSELKTLGVHKLGLFGSYANSTQSEFSDIDFLIEFEPGMKNYSNFFSVHEFLASLFNKKVDLVTEKAIDDSMFSEIRKYIIYEKL